MSFERLGDIGWDTINTVATLIIAVVGGLIGWYLGRAGRRQARFVALTEYRREIVAFANAAIAAMDRGAALARTDPQRCADFWERRNALTSEISTLVDQGRFFFPDIAVEALGRTGDAPPGTGVRDAVLNRLVAARHALRALDTGETRLNHRGMPILALREWGEGRKLGQAERDALFAEDAQKLQLLWAWDHLAAEHRQEMKALDWLWSCEQALIQAKRGFVSQIWPLTAPTEWNALVRSVQGTEIARREEEPSAD